MLQSQEFDLKLLLRYTNEKRASERCFGPVFDVTKSGVGSEARLFHFFLIIIGLFF